MYASASVFRLTQIPHLRITLQTFAASRLHWRAGPRDPCGCCDPKGRGDLLRVPSTEGRGVRLCWAPSKPNEPKGQQVVPDRGREGRRGSETMINTNIASVSLRGEYRGTSLIRKRPPPLDPLLRSKRTQGFAAGPVYGRARCSPMVGAFIT